MLLVYVDFLNNEHRNMFDKHIKRLYPTSSHISKYYDESNITHIVFDLLAGNIYARIKNNRFESNTYSVLTNENISNITNITQTYICHC